MDYLFHGVENIVGLLCVFTYLYNYVYMNYALAPICPTSSLLGCYQLCAEQNRSNIRHLI